ncbi:MAG: NotI family restriction endonuclease, partial [Pseudomonadales bacterium]
NVYKRYVTQLVRKGFVAHSWGTKIVAVIQDEFFDYMFEKYPFMKGNAGDAETNILFFTYKFSPDAPISSGEHTLSLDEVHGTNHASLQSAHLYKKSPTKPEFAAALVERLTQRQKNRAKFVDKHGKGAVTTFSKFEVFTSKGD